MVSLSQEQHFIMNFAVPFLKMLTLYMLWRAQFLTEFYALGGKEQGLGIREKRLGIRNKGQMSSVKGQGIRP